MRNFKSWLAEGVRTLVDFGADELISVDKSKKDEVGIPLMDKPGFRKGDEGLIVRDAPEVERKLNDATSRFGINWLIGYIAPAPNIRDWASYDAAMKVRMHKELERWYEEESRTGVVLPPPNASNTIVYVKPTSRVHPLTPHQMVHNIGHAVWQANPDNFNGVKNRIREAVRVLQQAAYDKASEPPTDDELAVMLGRLVNLLSQQRSLTVQPGDLDKYSKIALTGFNAWDENIFDLFPAFINAGGKIQLYPRGPGKIANFDRAAAIPPNPEIIRARGVRPWVWEKMAADREAWDRVSEILTRILIDALKDSVWTRQSGPIYPYNKLTTLP